MRRLLLCGAVLMWPTLAHAEADVIRIARGAGGVGFLPLLVLEQKGLMEQKARAAGIAKLRVEWLKYAEFMAGVGSLKMRPASWKDLFFPAIHGVPGG
jgi:hypothetical protein